MSSVLQSQFSDGEPRQSISARLALLKLAEEAHTRGQEALSMCIRKIAHEASLRDRGGSQAATKQDGNLPSKQGERANQDVRTHDTYVEKSPPVSLTPHDQLTAGLTGPRVMSRSLVEQIVQELLDYLDGMDAPIEDREPEPEHCIAFDEMGRFAAPFYADRYLGDPEDAEGDAHISNPRIVKRVSRRTRFCSAQDAYRHVPFPGEDGFPGPDEQGARRAESEERHRRNLNELLRNLTRALNLSMNFEL